MGEIFFATMPWKDFHTLHEILSNFIIYLVCLVSLCSAYHDNLFILMIRPKAIWIHLIGISVVTSNGRIWSFPNDHNCGLNFRSNLFKNYGRNNFLLLLITNLISRDFNIFESKLNIQPLNYYGLIYKLLEIFLNWIRVWNCPRNFSEDL